MINKEAAYVTDTEVYDPESDDMVRLEIWRDTGTGLLFALENKFMETSVSQTAPLKITSPYMKELTLSLRQI